MINGQEVTSMGLAIPISAMMIFLVPLYVSGQEADPYAHAREKMVETQIIRRGVKEMKVLEALRKVPRHLFVPEKLRGSAYEDHPLGIGFGQTISQPYIVAYMSAAAGLKSTDRVLEIGTGSGYQAAVLAEIVKEVYTVEIVEELAASAKNKLQEMGYENIFVKHGDGYQGWKEHSPYDAIIVTAAPENIPQELVHQLKTGGRMVIPIGSFYQELYLVVKQENGIDKSSLIPVRFVPMVK